MALKIDLETAKKLHEDSPEWFQRQLVKEFGAEAFKNFDYREITTYEAALKVELPLKDDIIYPTDAPWVVATKKLRHIIRIINHKWFPDFNNDHQKWYAWFNLSSGSGFSDSDYLCDHSITAVGSFLCTKDSERALWVFEHAKDLFKIWMLGLPK